MVRNISYKNKELNLEIVNAVGRPFNFIEILKLRGVGSPRLRIVEVSSAFSNLMPKIETGEYCNIEIRPMGIILRFRKHLDNMAWIIPYYKLSIIKSDKSFSLHADGESIKTIPAYKDSSVDIFFNKLLSQKAEHISKSSFQSFSDGT